MDFIDTKNKDKMRDLGYRIPDRSEFINGFKYITRGFKTSWKEYTYPDKPKDMKHHPADTFFVMTKDNKDNEPKA